MKDRNPVTNGPVSIGVDTGGTHTDIVLSGNNKVVALKVPSTPDDLSIGIMEGVLRVAALAQVPVEAIQRFVYGSTFVTNLFVEERQAGVGLITTDGFRDVLEIGRASRKPDVYDIHWRPAPPIVPRDLRLGVRERMDHRGRVITPLDEDSARRALESLAAADVKSIAVCLFHSYANPMHERRIAELAAEVCPEIEVSLSSDVVREFREFERTSTTCVSSFIKAPIRRHLQELKKRLAECDVPALPFIMRGNGGISTFDMAAEAPVAVTHSGVMGGIIGAQALAAACGIKNIITLDMGGTSADVSLIANGAPIMTNRSHIGTYPLLLPTLDMITIGAGGGSIAWIEGGTSLRVGPHSAGSFPGPVCYGQGGSEPTVTDANLVAGRLNADYFLGGARRLDLDRARNAIEEKIAKPLGMTVEEAALGILDIAEAHMVNAIRLITVERGLDPRDFTLVAFGGAGALHAVHLAEALSIRNIMIPPAPGNMSAMGLLCADVRHDYGRTVIVEAEPAIGPKLLAMFDDMLADAEAALVADHVDPGKRQYFLYADLRYRGQNYDLTVPVFKDTFVSGFDDLVKRFNEQHQRIYGYQLSGRQVQIVNIRVTAVGIVEHGEWPVHASTRDAPASVGRRQVLLGMDEKKEVPVYRFDELKAGHEIEGPAILEYAGGTLFLAADWQLRLDSMMNARLLGASLPLHMEQLVSTPPKELI